MGLAIILHVIAVVSNHNAVRKQTRLSLHFLMPTHLHDHARLAGGPHDGRGWATMRLRLRADARPRRQDLQTSPKQVIQDR
jgi:hypothetical protein